LYIVPVSAAHCHCPSNIKHTRRRLDTCLIQCVSHAAVHWSALTVLRQMRPYMQCIGLQPARYKEAAAYRTISRYRDMKLHDITISLLGYDMITTRHTVMSSQGQLNSTSCNGRRCEHLFVCISITLIYIYVSDITFTDLSPVPPRHKRAHNKATSRNFFICTPVR